MQTGTLLGHPKHHSDVLEMGASQPHVRGSPQKGRPIDGKGMAGLQVTSSRGTGRHKGHRAAANTNLQSSLPCCLTGTLASPECQRRENGSLETTEMSPLFQGAGEACGVFSKTSVCQVWTASRKEASPGSVKDLATGDHSAAHRLTQQC